MKLIKTIIFVIAGAILLPALFAFAIGLGSTIFAFILQPKVMSIFIAALLIISIPGIILGNITKK